MRDPGLIGEAAVHRRDAAEIPTFHVMHVPGADPERDRIVASLPDLHPRGADGICVHADPQRRGILATWLQALMHAQAEPSPTETGWEMVIQDDAIPVQGFEEHLPRALRHSPSPVLSLCHFGDAGQKIANTGHAYLRGTHTIWGQAVAYHRTVLSDLIHLGHDVQHLQSPVYSKWDDRLPGVLNLIKGEGTTAVTARALFDHPHLKSTVGHLGAVHRHPNLTIADPGPDWSAGFKETKAKPHGIMYELASIIAGREIER